jgi:putative transposase
MSDINNPATLTEIADVLGKHKSSVERQAKKEDWKFTEEQTKGRHNKQFYALKDLPRDIQYAVQRKRRDADLVIFTGALDAAHDSGQGQMESDGKGLVSNQSMDDGIALRDSGGDLSDYTAEQRDTGLAIQTVMRWIDKHPHTKAAALRELNQGYKDDTLSSPLKSALERCKQKSSGKARTDDILTSNTVDKWQVRFRKQGNYIPNVRQKDLSIQAWHIDLMPMLSKNRQKRCYTLIHEELLKAYPGLSYDAMTRWIREKYDRMDVIKGRNTGMQLRSKQAYQPRTSNGMEPWQEVHADGWNTHFTAPHPITGEFVTYELWDFHDVATRYIPPFGIGLTECFEVIAKGIENCIRDNGVMCILQTDSTKIIKNNAKFTGDPVKSISDKAGFTIVHPVTVGNAQANGISENWHTWADKQCRALATYQAGSQDSLTLRNVKKITAQMVKAADKGEIELRDKLKARAEKLGGGIVFGSYYEAVEWIEINLRQKWNNKPHSALPKLCDPITGKMRHQTPQECLDEHKANGWEPVMMDESILADLFRVHVKLKVERGMVKPYGGMLFRAPELGAYEGDWVIVAYDSMDYTQVWVKSLKGELICVAPFLAPTGYRSVTAYEAAQEKRAVAQIKNREKQIDQIKKRAGIDEGGNIIDGEVLQRVPLIQAEPTESLKRIVVDGGFNKQEPEEKPMSYQETVRMLKSANEYSASQ